MTITIDIPDEIAAEFSPDRNPGRAVLEAVALEGYRSERLTFAEVRRLLGIDTHMETDEFLKRHKADMHYTLDDFENDVAVALEGARRTDEKRRRELPAKRLA